MSAFPRTSAHLLALTGALVLGATSLTGCQASTPHHVVVVMGARANMPTPALDEEILTPVKTAAMDGGSIRVIVSDGQPAVTYTRDLTPEPGTTAQQAKAAEQTVDEVRQELSRQRAQEPEADVLESLAAASRSLEGQSGDREIVVIDSGLSTTGPLQFQAGLLNVPGLDVAQQLKDRDITLDLRGVTVTWVGIGDTAAPQQSLPLPARAALRDIWQSVITDNGGQVVFVGAQTAAQPALGSDLPTVTPVPVDAVAPLEGAGPGQTLAVLRDSTVGFLPNSANLRDPAAATVAIEPIATAAIRNGWDLQVTGTTSSWGSEQGRLDLSTARAQAVKQMLVDSGVPADRITTTGVGTHFPEFIPDRTSDGALDEIAAAQNRSVRIRLN